MLVEMLALKQKKVQHLRPVACRSCQQQNNGSATNLTIVLDIFCCIPRLVKSVMRRRIDGAFSEDRRTFFVGKVNSNVGLYAKKFSASITGMSCEDLWQSDTSIKKGFLFLFESKRHLVIIRLCTFQP